MLVFFSRWKNADPVHMQDIKILTKAIDRSWPAEQFYAFKIRKSATATEQYRCAIYAVDRESRRIGLHNIVRKSLPCSHEKNFAKGCATDATFKMCEMRKVIRLCYLGNAISMPLPSKHLQHARRMVTARRSGRAEAAVSENSTVPAPDPETEWLDDIANVDNDEVYQAIRWTPRAKPRTRKCHDGFLADHRCSLKRPNSESGRW
jgi:hypothetical protein